MPRGWKVVGVESLVRMPLVSVVVNVIYYDNSFKDIG